ncbi:MAG: hypothetical protein SynsKO_34730 [Synoicihabitans sp.]
MREYRQTILAETWIPTLSGMSSEIGVTVSKQLRGLRPALEEWIVLNGAIAKCWTEVEDVPWWYNERALLGVLAGAIWRTGGLAFEEYTQRKLTRNDRKDVGGRVDLWFSTKSGREFRAEAKKTEIPITQSADQLEKLNAVMAEAVDDAGRNPSDGGDTTRLAIAFASPFLTKKTDPKMLQSRVNDFLELFDDVDYDAIAWFFPKMKRLPVSESDHVTPGIVMWMKVVKRGRRA